MRKRLLAILVVVGVLGLLVPAAAQEEGSKAVPEGSVEALGPFGEDDGDINKANEIDPGDLPSDGAVEVQGLIGDGPYGSGGTGSGDFDWYRVWVGSGRVLVLDIDTPHSGAIGGDAAHLDAMLGVYSEAGTQVAFNDDGLWRDSYLEYTATTGGNYYIQVMSFGAVQSDVFDSSTGDGDIYSEGPYVLTIGVSPRYQMDTDSLSLLGTEAELQVVNGSLTTAIRQLLRLENNGAPRFNYEDSSTGDAWSFSMNGNGHFIVSSMGSIGPVSGVGGPELIVQSNGRVRMGPGGDTVFNLSPSGDLTLAGDLTVGGSCTGCGGMTASDRIAAVETENTELRALLQDLTARLEALETQ